MNDVFLNKQGGLVTLPEVVSREEWLVERKRLLEKEKDLTRASDALNAARRRLPMVKVDKDYTFDDPRGRLGLLDLFQGRQQLVVYHFMFGPDWEQGCPGCTAVVDEIAAGLVTHLRSRDTSLVIVSRAPLDKLLAYKDARGWTIDWCSSYGTDFNYDFHVTLDASRAPLLLNYRDADAMQDGAAAWATDSSRHPIEISGISCFLRAGSDVFHTYSTYERGTEVVISAYRMLDLTPLGRQEDWEEPRDRAPHPRPADPSFGGGLH